MTKRTRNPNPPEICTVQGCDRAHKARGYCSMHWKRWRKTGDPLKTIAPTPPGKCKEFCRSLLSQAESPQGCIKWPFATCRKGHAVIAPDDGIGKGTVHVARFLLEKISPRPSEKHLALHTCHKGHEACVNPSHLYWGTQADNTHDMVVAGRHPRQKINLATAQAIWEDRKNGTASQSAARFPGATVDIVKKIRSKRSWVKHLNYGA